MREKDVKGITLIALVITIIILLILAGISIAMLTGENGILTKANTSKQETTKQGAKEKVQVEVMGSYDNNGKINLEELNGNLKNNISNLTYQGQPISNSNKIENLPEMVTVDGYEIEIKENGEVIIVGEQQEEPKKTLPSTADTKPFLPDGATVLEDKLDKGVVIKDSSENEWVWIEVPKSIYPEGTEKTEHSAIETAMQTYAKDYRQSGYSDTFYSTAQHGFKDSTDYDDWKKSMLESVFTNGGFYIGRYEIGTTTPRTNKSEALTTPYIKQDLYPCNFITCAQAQELAKQLSTGGRQASLMFGIQWDLILKHIEEKGAKTQNELKTDSSSWGNYNNVTFEITRGEYTTAPSTSGSWNAITTYTKPASNVLLTTGGTDRNSILNIHNLAGNVKENTLERTSNNTSPCACRGGYYRISGNAQPACYRAGETTIYSIYDIGARPALW